MKKLYWRPQKVSLKILILIVTVSLACLTAVEILKVKKRQPFYKEKILAAELTKTAFEVVKNERLKRGLPIKEESDPSASGVIGVLASPTTTNAGHLPAKQTSINPNFAGLMVHYLKRLNIREGDVVAVAFSGSFPALNISTMAALETLKVKPIIICSVGASQWGANIPQYLWPDMERTLNEANVFKIKSAAASLGGVDDQALGLTAEGKKILKDSIIKNGIDFLEINSFQDSIDKRMDIYREKAAEKTIKAYINVGGGIISVGSETGKRIYKPGLNRRLPPGAKNIDSVMTRFSLDGVPVIHLSKIEEIAEKYEFPLQPEKMPACGDGKIFFKKVHNKWLAAAALTLILGMLYALLRLDWGFRLLPQNGMKTGNGHPEEMV